MYKELVIVYNPLFIYYISITKFCVLVHGIFIKLSQCLHVLPKYLFMNNKVTTVEKNNDPIVYYYDLDIGYAEGIMWLMKMEGFYVVHFIEQDLMLDSLYVERPDVIIIGIDRMHEEEHYKFIRRLNMRMEHNPTPFYIISTLGYPDQINKGLLAGALDYMVKPFNSSFLTLKIRNLYNHSNRKKSDWNLMGMPEKVTIPKPGRVAKKKI